MIDQNQNRTTKNRTAPVDEGGRWKTCFAKVSRTIKWLAPLQAGFWLGMSAGWLSMLISGCSSSPTGPASDQREPHYVLGENRVNAMDYRGAIQAFEDSLEVDPHSAAAHFQLGWLYDTKVPDPAAAIYHYEWYLKLDPEAGNASVVRQRIKACKQALAADVLGLPSMSAAQQRVEQLLAQNQQLENGLRQLQEENQQLRADLTRWSNACVNSSNSLAAARQSSFGAPANPTAVHPVDIPDETGLAVRDDWPRRQTGGMTGTWQTHTVVPGETAVRIARHYGISLEALLAANPGLEPRRMPVGLVLNIPLPQDSASSFFDVQRR